MVKAFESLTPVCQIKLVPLNDSRETATADRSLELAEAVRLYVPDVAIFAMPFTPLTARLPETGQVSVRMEISRWPTSI